MKTNQQTTSAARDAGQKLYGLNDRDFYAFDRAACAAGYSSGKAVANEHSLWSMSLGEALDYIAQRD